MFVTVLMPTYNRRNYVADAIESVLGQQHADFELIVVDDCSTDGTAEIVERYARQDDRIIAIHQTMNKGPAEACNAGLALARYDLIARLDDDDLMLPSRLDQQIEFMRTHPDTTVVSSWAYLIDEAGRTIGQSCPKVDLELGLATLNPALFLEIIQPATMYRKDDVLKVGGYRSVKLEDRDLWGRLVTCGYKIAVQPQFLVRHRRHGNSLMTTQLEKLFEFGDYIDFNIVRRLRGEAEISLPQYQKLVASASLMRRLSGKRRRTSQIAFRRATVFYSSRAWLPFAGNVAIATALAPFVTVRRAWEKANFQCGSILGS
jgi:alpha-1,3-rhamnosyltransferase